MNNLYIIGNGFDLAHELKTSYADFRCYLEKYQEQFLIKLEKMYDFYPLDVYDYYQVGNREKKFFERERNLFFETYGRQ